MEEYHRNFLRQHSHESPLPPPTPQSSSEEGYFYQPSPSSSSSSYSESPSRGYSPPPPGIHLTTGADLRRLRQASFNQRLEQRLQEILTYARNAAQLGELSIEYEVVVEPDLTEAIIERLRKQNIYAELITDPDSGEQTGYYLELDHYVDEEELSDEEPEVFYLPPRYADQYPCDYPYHRAPFSERRSFAPLFTLFVFLFFYYLYSLNWDHPLLDFDYQNGTNTSLFPCDPDNYDPANSSTFF